MTHKNVIVIFKYSLNLIQTQYSVLHMKNNPTFYIYIFNILEMLLESKGFFWIAFAAHAKVSGTTGP